MRNSLIPLLSTSIFAAVIGLAPSRAMAQVAAAEEASDRGLEEIVVTARRTTESSLAVPVAVTSIGQLALRNNNAMDLGKIGELAPQVLIGPTVAGTGAFISIRGIGSSTSDAGLDQSVSVELDGVQLSRGRIITAGMFDIEQVQVMKGPQALFFGKNSPAGVISIRSADPTSRFEGYLRGGYEFTAREKVIEGAVSGPLSSTLGARLAFYGSWKKGWIDLYGEPFVNALLGGIVTNPHRGRQPKGHDLAARLTLKWEPTDDFTARLKFTYSRQRTNAGNATAELFCRPGQTVPLELGTTPNPFGDCKKDRRTAYGQLPAQLAVNFRYGNNGVPYQKSPVFLGSVELTKEFGDVAVTSTTGYYNQTVTNANNSDNAMFTTVYFAEREKYKLVTEEVRITSDFSSPLNFTAGGYFEDFKRPRFNSPFLLNRGINPATGNFAALEQNIKNSGRTYSLFGQLRWQIMENLELAGGARWTHEKKSFETVYTAVNPTGLLTARVTPVGQRLAGRYSDDNLSPEATLTWRITPEQTLYGAYKTGYKSGGFSNAAVILRAYTIADLQFDAEKSKGFESATRRSCSAGACAST